MIDNIFFLSYNENALSGEHTFPFTLTYSRTETNTRKVVQKP